MTMEKVRIGKSPLESSRLVYGCMRLMGDGSQASLDRGRAAVLQAVETGYNVFDLADIYGSGGCETLFGEILATEPGLRERIVLQTKCGVRPASEGEPAHYDLSSGYILQSVDQSLARLGVDHIDILLLHRPDFLFIPDDVALAFDRLLTAGKVSYFGVSNFSPSQVSVLSAAIDMPIVVNQVEVNLHTIDRLYDGTLDQCLELSITPQAWSPLAGFAFPAWHNRFSYEQEKLVRREVERQAGHYGVKPWLIPIAWLLRHPSGITPIIGSTTPERIASAVGALDIDYSRPDWYHLLEVRNGISVP